MGGWGRARNASSSLQRICAAVADLHTQLRTTPKLDVRDVCMCRRSACSYGGFVPCLLIPTFLSSTMHGLFACAGRRRGRTSLAPVDSWSLSSSCAPRRRIPGPWGADGSARGTRRPLPPQAPAESLAVAATWRTLRIAPGSSSSRWSCCQDEGQGGGVGGERSVSAKNDAIVLGIRAAAGAFFASWLEASAMWDYGGMGRRYGT